VEAGGTKLRILQKDGRAAEETKLKQKIKKPVSSAIQETGFFILAGKNDNH